MRVAPEIFCLTLSIAALLSGCSSQPRLTPEQHAMRAAMLQTTDRCVRVSAPIQIDGRLDDAAWQGVEPITNFCIPVTWATPHAPTRAWLAYDDTYLYVGFEATDADLQAPDLKHDGDLYFGDVVEIFMKPRSRGVRFSEIEVSPLGTVLDATFWRARYTPKSYPWTCEGLLSAVTLEGTLNQPGDRDTRWCAELAIPFASLPDAGGTAPANGTTWTITLARYNYSPNIPGGQELISSSPLCINRFCHYQDWRSLRFE
jgi:hypothetical protein